MSAITPIVVAVIAAIFGGIGFLFQRRVDRHEEQKQKKQVVYEAAIRAFHEAEASANWVPDDAVAKADEWNHQREILLLYGSDEVVAASIEMVEPFYDWRTARYMKSDVEASKHKQMADAKAKLLFAMRNDLFDETDVSFAAFLKTIPALKIRGK